MGMFAGKMIQITLGTRCEARAAKPICSSSLVYVFPYAHLVKKQAREYVCGKFLRGEKQSETETDTVRKNLKASTNAHIHHPSPTPIAFLPGVFVNHPFRSVSLWVGPLPFNAGTFVARDSATIQLLCTHLTPQCVSHRRHLIRGT